MSRYKKIIYAVIVLVFVSSAGWSNPIYSSNGIGEIVPDNSGRARSMGGAGIANGDGMTILRGNPALVGTFKKHVYTFGVSMNRSRAFDGGAESPTFARTNAELFKLVVPVAKGLVVGWGMTPYSRNNSIIRYESKDFQDEMSFTGGINLSTTTVAYSFRDAVYFGVSYNYYFGMIEEKWARNLKTEEYYNSEDWIKRKHKGDNFSFGILAKVIGTTHVGLGYSSETDLNVTVKVRPGNFGYPEKLHSYGNMSLPETWRLGVSSVFKRRLTASMDFSLAGWESAAEKLSDNDMYNDTYSFNAGVRYAPGSLGEVAFFKKLPVSAGFKFGTMYYKSFPKVDVVQERAITIGTELPFLEDAATLITTFEFGIRGDKDKNGWEENYFNIGLALIGTIK